MGILTLKAHFNTSHAFLFGLCGGGDVSIEVIAPSARLVLASKISDPNNRFYDVEALEDKRLKFRRKISILPKPDKLNL